MKEKMPKFVRFLFFVLSIILFAIGMTLILRDTEFVPMLVMGLLGLFFSILVIIICRAKKRKLMVFPVLVGMLLTLVPLGTLGIGAVAAAKIANDEKKAKEQEEQEAKGTPIPPTYVYTEHFVSAPDSSPINRGDYEDRYETLNAAYNVDGNPYARASYDVELHELTPAAMQTGIFDPAVEENAELFIANIMATHIRIPGREIYSSRSFQILETLDNLGLSETDVLENIQWSTDSLLNVYGYRDFSYIFEYFSDYVYNIDTKYGAQSCHLRVTEYVYFNQYGYKERIETLWSASCDIFGSVYTDQEVNVYNYTQYGKQNAK